jgi:hypothetical protein
MPGFLLHEGATVLCAHAGQAQPTATNPRVTVGGLATVTSTAPYSIAGCAQPSPPNGNGPCVTAQWTSAATRITSEGQALLLFDSQATCTPTGTPLLITSTQIRVTGT